MTVPGPVESRDAVVIGSGFGGGTVALRLAEAGLDVLVLERGDAYGPADFPRDPRDSDRVFWRFPHSPTATGLYDVRALSGLGTVTASGVGGGSLVYAGVLVAPGEGVLAGWPPELRTGLRADLDRALAVLQPSPLPGAVRVRRRDALHAAAARLGRPVVDPPLGIAWEGAPGRGRCALDAGCETGCATGAKSTVDLVHLPRARAAGAEVRAGAWVSHISPAPGTGGGYHVHHLVRRDGAVEQAVVRGRRVVLAAGTLGTLEVLLRSRDLTGTLPGLGPRLGHRISANGDFPATLRGTTERLDPWHGPDVTSVIGSLPHEPAFGLVAPGSREAVIRAVAALGEPPVGWLRPVSGLVWPAVPAALRLALRSGLVGGRLPRAVRAPDDPARVSFLLGLGRDNAGGRAVLRRGRLDVRWRYARENAALVAAVERAAADVARACGGTAHPLMTWRAFRRPVTFHPLGGCRPGGSRRDGVVSFDGQVHGHPGLVVADGSLVPGSLGCHPALTIAALAERVAERGLLDPARGLDSS